MKDKAATVGQRHRHAHAEFEKRQGWERGRVLGRQVAQQLNKLSAAIVLLLYLLFASCRVLILNFCNLTYLFSF